MGLERELGWDVDGVKLELSPENPFARLLEEELGWDIDGVRGTTKSEIHLYVISKKNLGG